jgi:hypothetical protein
MYKKKTLLVVLMVVLLAAVVPTAAEAAMGGPATRIQFQPGATSGVVSGQLAPRQTRDYVLRASAGQIMQVNLWSNVGANVLIWGADGTPLKRWTNQEQGWQGVLPKTQDYYVQVVALDKALSYCLRVTVFARIQFASGATSGTVSSPVQHCVPQGAEVVGGYVLRASARQTMRVTLTSPNHNIYLTIVGANGVPLKYYDDWSTVWEGVLPTTQDYYLLPIATGADTRFTMTVWISSLGQPAPTRIRFAPGTTSATVSGSLTPGSNARYVLWAARGQRMEIQIWPAPAPGYIPPVIDVTVTGSGGSSWGGLGLDCAIDPLPASGDYVITLALRPGSPGTNYIMEVTIPAP